MHDYGCLGEHRIGDFGPFLGLRSPELGLIYTLPLQFLMQIFAGWVNRHQQDVIEYLQDGEA
jgi:hypothetical protein